MLFLYSNISMKEDIETFLLENVEEIKDEINLDVQKFLDNINDFQGQFKTAYRQALNHFIIECIKEVVLNHFNSVNPEDLSSIDMSYLKKINGNEYFEW